MICCYHQPEEQRSPLDIWKTLTKAQRATLVAEVDPVAARAFGVGCGSARHALARRGLLVVGQPTAAPGSGPGWHTPRAVTDLGRAVVTAGILEQEK